MGIVVGEKTVTIIADIVAVSVEIVILVIIKRHIDKLKGQIDKLEEQREKMDKFLMKFGEQSEILHDRIEKLEEQTLQENTLTKEKED